MGRPFGLRAHWRPLVAAAIAASACHAAAALPDDPTWPAGWKVRELGVSARGKPAIQTVTPLADGERVVVGLADQTVALWRFGWRQRMLHAFAQDPADPFDRRIEGDFVPSPDGQFIAGTLGSAHLWELATGRRVRRLPSASPPRALSFATGGQRLRFADSRGLHEVDAESGRSVRDEPPLAPGTGIAPGGEAWRFVVALADGTVQLWPNGGVEPREIRADNAVGNGIALSDDGRVLATAGRFTHRVQVWDTRQSRLVRAIPEPASIWAPRIALSPDGRWLMTGNDRGDVRFYDLATGEAVCRVAAAHARGVTVLKFAPDGRSAYSGGQDGRLLKWSADVPWPGRSWFARWAGYKPGCTGAGASGPQ